MAQQQALDVGGGNTTPQRNYAQDNAPQFVGGDTSPSGAIVPSSQSQADVAPPPATPTTQLANVNPPQSLASTLTPLAGSYLGGSIGGEIGAQVAGGADLSSAASSTLGNLGTVLREPVSGMSLSNPLGDATGAGFADGLGGAAGAGIGAGLVTAALGAATKQQPKVYVPEALGVGAGTFIGSLFTPILGPLGPIIGGELGSSKPVQTFISHAIAPVESFFSHLFTF
jgi:hypothetical protein